ncbi:MAG: protoheme IX farnesyltransferase [Pseudomonadales bacterium]|nr:protoheme IX farnesyltransferase [Pseudomonadales bacterium]
MTELTPEVAQRAVWRDYFEMCKPNVVWLMLLCSLVGMFLATEGMVPLDILIFGNLGLALVAGSAAALNHLLDSTIDARMARTRNRPVAQGRISMVQGLVFIATTGIAGMLILTLLVNPLTAWLNFASWLGYGIVYSVWLKRATPQNIVIGGLFGAAPPLFGWTAVTGSIDPGGLLLVLIIFAWTPPHFWALALDRIEDYRKLEDVPMLPVTHGEQYTRLHILLYTVILVIVTVLPWLTGMSGLPYLFAALGLGAGFLYLCFELLAGKDPKTPIRMFKYSIIYLMALFLALLFDHYWVPLG